MSDGSRVSRRRLLELLSVSSLGGIAGCIGEGGEPNPTGTVSSHFTSTRTPTATPTATETPTETGTPRENPITVYVSNNGSTAGRGTADDPLISIQHALEQVKPGDTVRVKPGRYLQPVQTVRGGTAGHPITITGPPDAVFNADGPFEINHSHVHLRGLTFDGLYQPSSPDDPESYSESILQINESFHERIKRGEHSPESVSEENYLQNVVVKPHAVGNCRADFIKVHWSKNVEISEFKVIGPAGVKFLKGDAAGHNSEIIYLGNAPSKGWPPDLTRNIHVHHIDNSAGYPHSELVDCKTGTSDVTIEYCTDAGGSVEAITDDSNTGAIHIGGNDITVRWNILSGGAQDGIDIGSHIAVSGAPPDAYSDGGTNNTIYGNRLLDNRGMAVQFSYPNDQGEDEQRAICGNEYNGPTHGSPDKKCPDGLPEGDGIGDLGGDSPWA